MPFLCGFSSGLLTAVILNPWDKALYLSVVEKRPFLDRRNFLNPYGGVFQTAVQRSLSSGLYFPLETKFQKWASDAGFTSNLSRNFLAGQGTGLITAFCINPLSIIRYRCWGTEQSFLKETNIIFKDGILATFNTLRKGTFATCLRDVSFGVVFCCVRSYVPRKDRRSLKGFSTDLASAALATIGSSPFNYCRNMIYSAPLNAPPPSIVSCLSHLSKCNGESGLKALSYLQARLRIGWGTSRVAFGMAMSSQLYEICLENTSSL